MERRKVVVLGAGGFVGAELLRLVSTHPRLELAAALSRSHAGRAVGEIHPQLAPLTKVRFEDPSAFAWETVEQDAWTVLAALAHGESAATLPALLDRFSGRDVQLVDLSGDFRLGSADDYERAYGRAHPARERLGEAVYGLPELARERIAGASWVANPGCFATAAILALAPAAAAGWKVCALALSGVTGSSGAGVEPRPTTHHPRRATNVEAYRPLVHQHLPEIRAAWRMAGGDPEVPLGFVPHRGPMVRGIYLTAQLFVDCVEPKLTAEAYHAFYRDAPFMRVLEKPPSLVEVWGTNRCDLSVAANSTVVAVTAALDNLVKGAAGQAIQNVNLMNRWDETSGLLHPVPSPV